MPPLEALAVTEAYLSPWCSSTRASYVVTRSRPCQAKEGAAGPDRPPYQRTRSARSADPTLDTEDSTWRCPYLRGSGCDVIASLPLREVVDAALEEGLVLVAGDVLGDVGAGAFAVAHLAEDTSARAGDAFDGFERSVGIELDAVRGRTGSITILEGDLAVLDEVGDDGRRRGEAAFAM